MVDVLLWVGGSIFCLTGLFCLFASLLVFIGWRQGMERPTFPKFLAWLGAGVAGEALMVFFYTYRP